MSIVRSGAAVIAAVLTVYAIQVLQLMTNNAAERFAHLRFAVLTAAMAAFVAAVIVIESRLPRSDVRLYAAAMAALILLGMVIGDPAVMVYTPGLSFAWDTVTTLAHGVSVPAFLIAGYGAWRGWGGVRAPSRNQTTATI